MKSITDFGAVGDGTTDNFDALTAAFASDPGIIEIPPGVYCCSKTLILPYDISLDGSGRMHSIIRFASGQEGISRSGNTYPAIEARNFTIEAGDDGTCMYLGGATQSTIENVTFSKCGDGLYLSGVSGTRVNGCFFSRFSGSAVIVASPDSPDGGDNWISENFFINYGDLSGKGTAIYHEAGGGLKILHNKVLTVAHGYHGAIDLRGATTSALIIEGNSIEGFSEGGITLTPLSSGNMWHVIISGNQGGSAAGVGATDFININGGTGGVEWVHALACNGNVIRNSGGRIGIAMDCVGNFTIGSNVIGEAVVPTGPAIFIGSSCHNGRVVGNSISNYSTPIVNLGHNVTVTAS